MDPVRYFCIAHKQVLYPLPPGCVVIWTGERSAWTGPPGVDVRFLADISDELYAWHPFLANSAANFAIAEILANEGLVRPGVRLCIITYRKFFGFTPMKGVESKGIPGMYLVDRRAAAQVSFDDFERSAAVREFCLARPVDVESVLAQYLSSDFSAADFLRHLAFAVDRGIISDRETSRYLSFRRLIPGGAELGLMPTILYSRMMRVLRDVTFDFLRRHSVSRFDPMSRRSLAHCNERLGSYLLFRAFSKIRVDPGSCFGYLHNVLESGQDDYVPGVAAH